MNELEKYERICDFVDGHFVITYTEKIPESKGQAFIWSETTANSLSHLLEWADAGWNIAFMGFTDRAKIMLKLLGE